MIEVLAAGPLITMQDGGRPGWLSQGLARGGAADLAALAEARALLQGEPGAGIEIPGAPLRLRSHAEVFLAFTGAEMQVTVDGRAVPWWAAHAVPAGAEVDLRPTGRGVYSYVHVLGGFQTPELLNSRAAHLIAGILRPLTAGDALPCGASSGTPRRLDLREDRFAGGALRVLPTPQTALFPPQERTRFAETAFTRDTRGNRQGVRLSMSGPGFATEGQLSLLSDFILPGDIQMTGDGVPYILGPECQTTGGYPRIGSVIAADLPRALQTPPGAPLRFRFVTLEEARAATAARPTTAPLVRAPGDLPDLLSMQLIDGVVSARPEEEDQ